MAIYSGANTPSNFYVGANAVSALYQGTTKLWPTVFNPVAHLYAAGAGGTETIPAGATNLVIAVWGSGNQGQQGYRFGGGDGGNGGAYVESHFNVASSNGKTISYFAGNSSGTSNSTATGGTFSMTQMVAGAGTASVAGNASGGNYSNVNGTYGGAGQDGSDGMGGPGGTGYTVNIGGTWYQYGYGGDGNDASISQPPPMDGMPGAVLFYYT